MLFFIIIFVWLSSISQVLAQDELGFKQPTKEDISLANELYGNALKILAKSSENTGFEDSKHNFYVFVSFGMNKENIKSLAEMSVKYKGILVVRGFKDSSFIKTASFAQEITKEASDIGFIIDPNLFKKYQITQVPSFVLAQENICPANTTCPNIYDKLSGNVMPDFALNKFAASGDLSIKARRLLKK